MIKWYKEFKSCCENIIDENHPGRPISVTDKTLENKVDTIIQWDGKVRLSNVEYRVNVPYGIVQNVVTKKTEIS